MRAQDGRASVPGVTLRASLGVCGAVVCWLGRVDAAPRDFTVETRAVYSVAACGEKPPAEFDAGVVSAHCRVLAKTIGVWKTQWRDKAVPFFTELLKAGYPSTVVYPFGGGDVVTMLAVFPDATEYTSLSLEGIGDPRPAIGLGGGERSDKWRRAEKLSAQLTKLRSVLAANLGWAWNTTNQLSVDSSGTGLGIPNILAIALVALDAHGYEPLEARYFDLAVDGSLTYLTQERIDAWDAERAAQKTSGKFKLKDNKMVQEGIFNNIEIVFRKKGDAKAPKKTFRHIAADLSDEGLGKHRGAYAYLDARRDFAAITKASSYLLWKPDFDLVRKVLLARMKLMVSDDTGMPPTYAKAAGFTQKVWGAYTGAFFKRERIHHAELAVEKEMVALWQTPVEPTIKFRFGYYDNRRHAHVMFTYK